MLLRSANPKPDAMGYTRRASAGASAGYQQGYFKTFVVWLWQATRMRVWQWRACAALALRWARVARCWSATWTAWSPRCSSARPTAKKPSAGPQPTRSLCCQVRALARVGSVVITALHGLLSGSRLALEWISSELARHRLSVHIGASIRHLGGGQGSQSRGKSVMDHSSSKIWCCT